MKIRLSVIVRAMVAFRTATPGQHFGIVNAQRYCWRRSRPMRRQYDNRQKAFSNAMRHETKLPSPLVSRAPRQYFHALTTAQAHFKSIIICLVCIQITKTLAHLKWLPFIRRSRFAELAIV